MAGVVPVTIEPMRETDLEAVQQIDRRSFPQPWTPTVYQTELSNRAAFYFVARLGPKIIGFSGAWAIAMEAHITTLAVDPDHRGQRVGERLLLALMEEAILRGVSLTTLEVRPTNTSAHNLYRKYGFRNTAVRKNYYSDTSEDAIVMWADAVNTFSYRQRLYELRQQLYSPMHEDPDPRPAAVENTAEPANNEAERSQEQNDAGDP